MKNKAELWVTNIARKKDIIIDDLSVKIPAGKSINLLDDRHYGHSWEEIRNSIKNGSIAKKNKWIKVRANKPFDLKDYQSSKFKVSKQPQAYVRLPKTGTKVDTEKPVLKEFEFLDRAEEDEEYALEAAESSFDDRAPALPVDKRFKKKGE